jgi:hypothetical protein
MNNFKNILIMLFSAFFLVLGIIALNHSHSEGALLNTDKDHCSICAYVSTSSNAILIILFFTVIFFAATIQIINHIVVFVRKSFFLPPSLAPPVFV